MENIEFNKLEFNLYELLNLPVNCSTDEIKKKFKKLIKMFHPDKITEVEEKIYYNLTIANHVLGNESSRQKYDIWLLNSHKSHSTLKDTFKSDEQKIREYFPQSKEEAQVEFSKNFEMLGQRHGNVMNDERPLQTVYKDKEKERKTVSISKEDFSSMDEFNNRFSERKQKGVYSTQIVKRTTDIQPFSFKTTSGNSYAQLKDFDKVYINDDQYRYAFELMPSDETKMNTKSIGQRMDDYNKESNSLKNNSNNRMNINNLNF
jgi:curved DNA-binding protein CbpA